MNASVRAVIGAVMIGVFSAVGGCNGGAFDPSQPVSTPYEGAVHGASLRGEMGATAGFAGQAEVTIENNPWGTGRHTMVRLDLVDPSTGRWAMTMLNLAARLDGPELQPGSAYSATGDEMRAGTLDPGGPVISDMLGCVGPRRGEPEYDGTPDRVDLRVEQGAAPDRRVLVFTAHFPGLNGEQDLVEGSLEYSVVHSAN